MSKKGYTMVGANLREDDLRLARYLMEKEHITPSDLVRNALLELANKHISGINDWDAFKLAATAVKEREQRELLELELTQARVEIQALKALVPNSSNVKEKEPHGIPTTVVDPSDPTPEFCGARVVQLVN